MLGQVCTKEITQSCHLKGEVASWTTSNLKSDYLLSDQRQWQRRLTKKEENPAPEWPPRKRLKCLLHWRHPLEAPREHCHIEKPSISILCRKFQICVVCELPEEQFLPISNGFVLVSTEKGSLGFTLRFCFTLSNKRCCGKNVENAV